MSVLRLVIKAKVSSLNSSTPITLTLLILNLKSGNDEKSVRSNSPKSTFAFKLLFACSLTIAIILSGKYVR